MRRVLVAALSLLLVQTFSTAAQAAIEVSMEPHPIRQCSPAHFHAAVKNDSSETLAIDVTASLENRSRQIAELHVGRIAIPAGETFVRDIDFMMPYIANGSYVIKVHASLADGSSLEGSARFTVSAAARDSNCLPNIPLDLLSILASNLIEDQPASGRAPRSRPTYITSSGTITWQAGKTLYR